jgi:aconitate hydratase
MFGIPRENECDYSTLLELDLSTVEPSVSGPKRPQDRISLPELKNKFAELLQKPIGENGYNKTRDEIGKRFSVVIGARGNGAYSGGGEQQSETAPLAVFNTTTENDTNVETEVEMINNRPTPDRVNEHPIATSPGTRVEVGHGDVLIAAITSCTNTSNPSVMLAAGLLAKKAVEKGLTLVRW